MKIAYGIITHKDSKILSTLVDILYKDNTVYLHIDSKFKLDNFKKYEKKVSFIEDRSSCSWGTYEMIDVMLRIIRKSLEDNNDYICFLSGDCLPVKNQSYINNFFRENRGVELIGIQKEINQDNFNRKVKYKHKDIHYKKDKNIIEKIYVEILYKFNMLEKNKDFEKIKNVYKGPNWICISKDFCEYIINFLEENNWYLQLFKNSVCGDEMFFQTLIMNSQFKERIYNIEENIDDNKMALRYIDWESGPQFPKILNESDFNEIKESNCLFARKFSDSLDIDNYLKEFNIDIN